MVFLLQIPSVCFYKANSPMILNVPESEITYQQHCRLYELFCNVIVIEVRVPQIIGFQVDCCFEPAGQNPVRSHCQIASCAWKCVCVCLFLDM